MWDDLDTPFADRCGCHIPNHTTLIPAYICIPSRFLNKIVKHNIVCIPQDCVSHSTISYRILSHYLLYFMPHVLPPALRRALSTLLVGNATDAVLPPPMDTSSAPGDTADSSWPAEWTDERLLQMLSSQYRSAVPKLVFSLCQAACGFIWNIFFQQHCLAYKMINTKSVFGTSLDTACPGIDIASMPATYKFATNILLFLLRLHDIPKVRCA